MNEEMEMFLDNLYAIGDEDCGVEDMVIVEADSQEDAVEKFCRYEAPSWESHFYNKSINLSFAEEFYYNGNEYIFGDDSKTKLDRAEINKIFINNVKEFFGSHENYGDMYLKYYFDPTNKVQINFPDDMLVYMYKKSVFDKDVILLKELNFIPKY